MPQFISSICGRVSTYLQLYCVLVAHLFGPISWSLLWISGRRCPDRGPRSIATATIRPMISLSNTQLGPGNWHTILSDWVHKLSLLCWRDNHNVIWFFRVQKLHYIQISVVLWENRQQYCANKLIALNFPQLPTQVHNFSPWWLNVCVPCITCCTCPPLCQHKDNGKKSSVFTAEIHGSLH